MYCRRRIDDDIELMIFPLLNYSILCDWFSAFSIDTSTVIFFQNSFPQIS